MTSVVLQDRLVSGVSSVKRPGGGSVSYARMRAQLYCGDTLIASHTFTTREDWRLFEFDLAADEIAAITDWDSIRLVISNLSTQAGIRVSFTEIDARRTLTVDPTLFVKVMHGSNEIYNFNLDPDLFQQGDIVLIPDDQGDAIHALVSDGKISGLKMVLTGQDAALKVAQAYIDARTLRPVPVSMTVTLFEDVSGTPVVRASFTQELTSNALVDREYSLSAAQISAIVDWTKLSLKIEVDGPAVISSANIDASVAIDLPPAQSDTWPGTTMRYHPGVILVASGALSAAQGTIINRVAPNPNIIGFTIIRRWGLIESSAGVFDFASYVDPLVALATQYKKYFVFWPGWASYSASLVTDLLPPDLYAAGEYVFDPDGGGSTGVTAAKIYKANVLARFQAYLRALANHLKDNPYFLGFELPETSYPVTTSNDPAYSIPLYQAAYESTINMLRTEFPTLHCNVQINFTIQTAHMAAVAAGVHAALGHPDTYAYRSDFMEIRPQGDRGVFQVERQYGVKGSGQCPVHPNIQGSNYTKSVTYPPDHPLYPGQTHSNPTAAELMDFCWRYLGAQYITWQPIGSDGDHFAEGLAALNSYVAAGQFPVPVAGT